MAEKSKPDLSGILRHFLIYDVSYAFSGLIFLLSIGYLYFEKLPDVIKSLANQLPNNWIVSLFVIGISYFIGLIIYDVFANIVIIFEILKNNIMKRGSDHARYEKLIIALGVIYPDAKDEIINIINRHDHFEVIGGAFFSSSIVSIFIILFSSFFGLKDNSEKQIILAILAVLAAVSIMNFICARIFWDAKIKALEKKCHLVVSKGQHKRNN